MNTSFDYQPQGVCSKYFHFVIEDNKIKSFQVIGGCNGNLKGIGALLIGMNVDDAIERLDGIQCRNMTTSCPDQISRALREYKSGR